MLLQSRPHLRRLRHNPDPLRPENLRQDQVIAPTLNGGWYSGSHVNHDEHGILYIMRGTNLVAIDDRPA